MFRKILFNPSTRQRVSLVIAALLILPFAIFFTANARIAPPGPGGAAGRVFGETIPWETFERQRGWLRQRFAGQFGGEFPEALNAVLTEQTWEMLALVHEAKRRRVRVADDELAAVITQIPIFQDQGRFRRERYDQMLRAMNTSPQTFEGLVRNDLALQKLLASVRNEVTVIDEEARQAFAQATEQRRATLMLFAASAYEKPAARALKDDEVRAYYDQHPDAFSTPEQLTLEYAGASREALRSKVSVTDEDVRRHYDERASEFQTEGQTAPAPFEDVRDQARRGAIEARVTKQLAALAFDLQDDLAAGLRFEEIAQARALVVTTAGPVAADGSTLGEVPPAVFRAVAGRPIAELSDVIRAEDGVYIARATARIPSELKPFETVKADARRQLLDTRARAAARDAAFAYRDRVSAAMQQGARFEEAVLSAGAAPAVHAATFTRSGDVAPLGSVPAVNQAGFDTALGQLSQVLEVPSGYVLLRPEEHVPPDPSAFDGAKETWREQALETKRNAHLMAWLEDVRTRAKITSFIEQEPVPADGQAG